MENVPALPVGDIDDEPQGSAGAGLLKAALAGKISNAQGAQAS